MGRKGDGRSDSARIKVRQFKADPQRQAVADPARGVPVVRRRASRRSRSRCCRTDDQPRELRIVCTNFECDFIGDRPLPIVAVDEPIYRRLPAFLIATVDKFATLPWVGAVGRTARRRGPVRRHGFYGAAEPRQGTPLPAPLPPPDLVIQDELHLISGPLGTMAGLYETAIDGLCVARVSTAGSWPAEDRRLDGDGATRAGPDPGAVRAAADADLPAARVRTGATRSSLAPCRRSTRRRVATSASPPRAAIPKVVMRKVWLALMGAAERCYRDAGGHDNAENPADPYMTVSATSTACASWAARGGSSRRRSATRSAATASAAGSVSSAGSSRTAGRSPRSSS